MYNTAVYTHVNLMATCRSDTSENGDSDKTAPRPRLMYVLLIIVHVGYCVKTDGSQCQMVSASISGIKGEPGIHICFS